MIWAIFFSFNYIYFRKRSTVLAAVWTISDAVFATASFILSIKEDKKTSLTYLPLTTWTVFASILAGYQALKNPDKALGTKALIS
jgi:benzodiazapine receptor